MIFILFSFIWLSCEYNCYDVKRVLGIYSRSTPDVVQHRVSRVVADVMRLACWAIIPVCLLTVCLIRQWGSLLALCVQTVGRASVPKLSYA